MRDLWPPEFLSHKDWDSRFPGIGYPDYAKEAVLRGIGFSDASSEVDTGTTRKSITTLGPRVYFVPVLLDPNWSKLRQGKSTASSRLSSHAAEEQQFSLPLSISGPAAEQQKWHSLPPVPRQEGAFKVQRRVNAPVSLEEKQSQKSKPPKSKPDPQAQIDSVRSKMEELRSKVEQFTGTSSREKDYRFLDEMLTRQMLKLDDVETDSHPNLRQERKKAVKEIQSCIALLEHKLAQNQASQTGSSI